MKRKERPQIATNTGYVGEPPIVPFLRALVYFVGLVLPLAAFWWLTRHDYRGAGEGRTWASLVLVLYLLGWTTIFRRRNVRDSDWIRPSVLITHYQSPWLLFYGALFYTAVGQELSIIFTMAASAASRASASGSVDRLSPAPDFVNSPGLFFQYAAFVAGAWGVLNTAVIIRRQRVVVEKFYDLATQFGDMEEDVRTRNPKPGLPSGFVEKVYFVGTSVTIGELGDKSYSSSIVSALKHFGASPHCRTHVVVPQDAEIEGYYRGLFPNDPERAMALSASARAEIRHLDNNNVSVWRSHKVTAAYYFVTQTRCLEFLIVPDRKGIASTLLGESIEESRKIDYVYSMAEECLRKGITPEWTRDGALIFPCDQENVGRVLIYASDSSDALAALDRVGEAEDVAMTEIVPVGATIHKGVPMYAVATGIGRDAAPRFARIGMVKLDRPGIASVLSELVFIASEPESSPPAAFAAGNGLLSAP